MSPEQEKYTAQKARIKSLDGLRAFAIIFVLFSHSTWKYNNQITLKVGGADFHNLLYNGWFGVDLFFVLSGFLIASQLLNKSLIDKNLKSFMARRFFRIAPAYYVAIFLTLFIYYLLPNIGTVPVSELAGKWWYAVLAHLIFLHDYIGREPSINGLFWSIPIEIKFYLLLPFILFLVTKIINKKAQTYSVATFFILYVLCKTALIYALYHGQNTTYSDYFLLIKTPFHLSLDGLTIGVFCAFLLRDASVVGTWHHSKQTTNTLFVIGLGLFAINGLSPHFTNDATTFFEHTLMSSLFALSFGLMLIGLVLGCFATEFFSTKPLRFIAKISYSLYLTHIFAISIQEILTENTAHYIASPTLNWLVCLPLFFALSVAFAYILHKTIEQPFIDWSKKKFAYKA